jgi:hypothetical protein
MLDSVHNLEIIQNAENILLQAVNVENKNLVYSRKVKKMPEISDIFISNGKI